MTRPGTYYFDDAGRFRSVKHATTHAILVQGGFTTDEIEAERMTKSDDPVVAAMGRDWLAQEGTTA